ncbi:hypothetical protein NAPIS_ORF01483 [Vairimorpha apis BRL 01]|uniref:Uncharacterized protein n=1 Tax=Vairimorpha apis BRL 01 TaxID=1037528 RepID=T0L091_9MICR|nr:hypothetical protein NAPIS_ORF01483 [Vairimorpha apis BRL 01]
MNLLIFLSFFIHRILSETSGVASAVKNDISNNLKSLQKEINDSTNKQFEHVFNEVKQSDTKEGGGNNEKQGVKK